MTTSRPHCVVEITTLLSSSNDDFLSPAGPGSSLSGGAIGGISAAVMVVAVLAVIAGAIIKGEN